MLIHPPIAEVSLEVADCAWAGTVYKQKVHEVAVFIPLGGPRLITLEVYLTAYARNPDGTYGAAISTAHVPRRRVSLVANPGAAVDPTGRVCFRELVPGLVRNMLTSEEITLPEGQSFAAFLDALPGPYLLQNEAMAKKRDTDEVCVRKFVEEQITLADAPPSSFA
jgi:hypothetical protein